MSYIFGHYWPFQAPGWLGSPPKDWDPGMNQGLEGKPIPPDWHEAVIDRSLAGGILLRVERFGLVRYDFSAWTQTIDKAKPDFEFMVDVVLRRLRVMNTFLLMSHVAHLEDNAATQTSRVNHMDLFQFADDGSDFGGGPGFMKLPILVQHLDGMRGSRSAASATALERSAELLDAALLCEADDALEWLDLLHFGLAMYQHHDYAQALVAAWTVCEQLVAVKWDSYLTARSTEIKLADHSVLRLNKKRRKKLQSPAFSMSTVLEILELAGELDHELFRQLQGVRSHRNRWLHRLDRPDSDSAGEALLAATTLLREATELPLQISLGLNISG